MSNRVLVIGAVNVDIFASSNEKYTLEDSNKASIHLGFGGVGGNIATNLSILEQNVSFLTAFSDDILGRFIRSRYNELNIDTSESYISKTSNASVYLGILDQNNDLFLGLNDMEIIKELDIAYLQTKHDYINSFDYIVIDTNFDKETLGYFFKKYQDKHIFIDAVSAQKVCKLKEFLPYISTLKLNQLELDALSNETNSYQQIIEILNKGVKELLITNKDLPVHYASINMTKQFDVVSCTEIVNATGAGDAFFSGYIKGFINKEPLEKCMEHAMKLATETLKVPRSTIEKGDYKW